MRTKKGSLNLSINAIVILILAITMLGLGLAFMRNIFGSATSEFSEVSGTVQKQMIEQLKETSKVVDINNPKVDIKPGEKKQIFLGFKNDDSTDKKFQIRKIEASQLGTTVSNIFTIVEPNAGPTANTVINDGANVGKCGSRVGVTELPTDPFVYIEFKNATTNVEGSGGVVVLPLNIHATSGALAAISELTCVYELKVDVDADTVPATGKDYSEIIELTIDVSN